MKLGKLLKALYEAAKANPALVVGAAGALKPLVRQVKARLRTGQARRDQRDPPESQS